MARTAGRPLVAVAVGSCENDLFHPKFFRLEGREPNPSPRRNIHEKDRLPVFWPLGSFAPVADAIGLRRPPAIDRPGGCRRRARRRRSLFPRASLRPPARLPLPVAGCCRREDLADRGWYGGHRHAV